LYTKTHYTTGGPERVDVRGFGHVTTRAHGGGPRPNTLRGDSGPAKKELPGEYKFSKVLYILTFLKKSIDIFAINK
jgi:hypothetical protein